MKHFIMKTMGIISIILLCCTLICGSWVAAHPVEDLQFHAVFSAGSVVFAIITQIVTMMKCRFCKKH